MAYKVPSEAPQIEKERERERERESEREEFYCFGANLLHRSFAK
jgi:hypothetical protein